MRTRGRFADVELVEQHGETARLRRPRFHRLQLLDLVIVAKFEILGRQARHGPAGSSVTTTEIRTGLGSSGVEGEGRAASRSPRGVWTPARKRITAWPPLSVSRRISGPILLHPGDGNKARGTGFGTSPGLGRAAARNARLRGSGAGRRVPASDRAGVWGGAPSKKREGRPRHRVEPPIGRSRGDYFEHRETARLLCLI